MSLLLLILCGIFAFATVFITCEIGQRINDAFGELAYAIVQFDWYLLPMEIKRMLPVIIAIAHKPFSLKCFGCIICTREVFIKVSIKQSNQQSDKLFKFYHSIFCPDPSTSIFVLYGASTTWGLKQKILLNMYMRIIKSS